MLLDDAINVVFRLRKCAIVAATQDAKLLSVCRSEERKVVILGGRWIFVRLITQNKMNER